VSAQPPTTNTGQDAYAELKNLRLVIRSKNADENNEEYLKDVWPTVLSTTNHEGAKKLWLTSVTTDPMVGTDSAQSNYERLVLEDMDDEESQVKRARGRLDRGSRLEPLWHTLKQTVSPARYVKVLREVTKGRRGEIVFVKLPVRSTTVAQMDVAVQGFDLEQQYYEDKRKKEVSQPAKPPGRVNIRQPSNFQSRPFQQGAPPSNFQSRPFQQGAPPSNFRNRPFQQKPPGPQGKPTNPPASSNQPGKGQFLTDEEYRKLSPEERTALRESRKAGAGGSPK
jgi:hypothetical protein